MTGVWYDYYFITAAGANSQEGPAEESILPGPISESDSSFTDTSSTLFSLYLSHAEKHDKERAESWKASADGTLVFVSRIFRFDFIILSLMNRTLTTNYYIFRI